jgi:leucyl aminopeptidase
MKITGKRVLIAVLIAGAVLTACSKTDEEAERKEYWTSVLLEDISADSIGAYIEWLEDMGTRFALADNRRVVAMKIANNFKRLGCAETELDSFFIVRTYRGVEYRQYQYNVIASLPGEPAYDSVCVMGAHYDNILTTGNTFATVPGANDNASGVAAMLEIARVMKLNDYKPRNTIRFVAFGAEELGLLGSADYAMKMRTSFSRIMLMLNNDMIAYETDSDRSKWNINIIDYNNSRYLRKTAEQLCIAHTGLGAFNDNTNYNRSDSYPFFNNGFKPLFFFSAKVDPNYHTLNDLASNCNYEYCREVVKLNCAILVDKN